MKINKINPNDPATGHEYGKTMIGGRTIRTQFAAMAMQGVIANKGHLTERDAQYAVEYADKLINALNAEPFNENC